MNQDHSQLSSTTRNRSSGKTNLGDTTEEVHSKNLRRGFLCAGVRIDALGIDDACSKLTTPRHHNSGAVHLCNAFTVALAQKDPRLAACLQSDALNLPDGMPIIWIARLLGFGDMRRRVYGPDLMLDTMKRGVGPGTRHFLFGSTQPILTKLAARLNERIPGLQIVGVHSPPFTASLSDDYLSSVQGEIFTAGADVVWVGMGTPKQDILVHRMSALSDSWFVAVGAAFDFHAGNKRQAPVWLQRSGLEWLFRLATEPRRLWRRYLFGNVRFAWSLVQSPPARIDTPPALP